MTDWQTEGTPGSGVTPGADPDINQAYPLPYTWLSKDQYARVMGIPPMPFNTAVALNTSGEYVMDASGACDDFWYRHDWQDFDKVSHESLLLTIKQCEDELMEAVGWPLAPTWIVEEVQDYQRHHRRDMYGSGLDVRGGYKSLTLDYGKVIAGGRRAVAAAGTTANQTVTYYDLDSDGFFETARLAVTTTITNPLSIKVYFKNTDGDPEWEIRPCRTISIAAGVATIDFYTWQMIDPDVLVSLPANDENSGLISITGNPPANVVAEVDVYREYNDTTTYSSQFMWAASPHGAAGWCPSCSGSGCDACGLTYQNGCLDVISPQIGEVAPWPGTYDSDNSDWDHAALTICREPDMVKIWYYAGEYNQTFLKSREFDPLSRQWQRIIARMATSRLDRPVCSCGQLQAQVEHLRKDMAMTTGGESRMLSFAYLENPFGTRVGEIEAWRFVSGLVDRNLGGFAL